MTKEHSLSPLPLSKIFHLTPSAFPLIILLTTPATPLHDAHQAGYFFCLLAAP